jgi:hypothetical protein
LPGCPAGAGIAVERTANEGQEMNLTEPQRNALLKLGESASDHEFIDVEVLKELLAFDLVYWRWADGFDFSSTDESVYDVLAGLN